MPFEHAQPSQAVTEPPQRGKCSLRAPDPIAEVRALAPLVGNQALMRMLAARAGPTPRAAPARPVVARMRIIEMQIGSKPHDVISEIVEFEKNEQLPDKDGRRGDDGYFYAQIGENRYRRTRRKSGNSDLRKQPLYQTLYSAFEEDGLMTASQLRALAESKKGDLADTEMRAIVEQFLDDFFERAIRFTKPEHLEPKSGTKRTFTQEHEEFGSWGEATREQAAKHMSQNSDLTDMISLALSEGALLRNAGKEVCTLMFDEKSEKHAPLIYEFLVPKSGIITPQTLKLGGLDAHRSTSETEVLYYGSGLERYATGKRPNPYTKADQQLLQDEEKLRKEEKEAEAAEPEKSAKGEKPEARFGVPFRPSSPSPSSSSSSSPTAKSRKLDLRKFTAAWRGTLQPLLVALPAGLRQPPSATVVGLLKQMTELANSVELKMGQVGMVRAIDGAIAALKTSTEPSEHELFTAWSTLMADYYTA